MQTNNLSLKKRDLTNFNIKALLEGLEPNDWAGLSNKEVKTGVVRNAISKMKSALKAANLPEKDFSCTETNPNYDTYITRTY